MDLTVVVTTLNARERLAACLDSLAAHGGGAEVVVVNGPSTDGTTGLIRERDDVDVLCEVADRNVNAARNAGFEAAAGDAIAFVTDDVVVEPGWHDAVAAALAEGADVVTGPVRSATGADADDGASEPDRVGGLDVQRLSGENVAFTRDALADVDGFDEYLSVGGSRDTAHRAAGLGLRTTWAPDAVVRRDRGAVRADGDGDPDWGATYRSLSYRLAKNYGPRPLVVARTLRRAVDDGASAFAEVVDGSFPPSRWLGNGRTVAGSCCRGFADGLVARYRSGPERNPNGASSRRGRAVRTYDWR